MTGLETIILYSTVVIVANTIILGLNSRVLSKAIDYYAENN